MSASGCFQIGCRAFPYQGAWAVPDQGTGLFPVEVGGLLPKGSRAVPSDSTSHGATLFTSPSRAVPKKICDISFFARPPGWRAIRVAPEQGPWSVLLPTRVSLQCLTSSLIFFLMIAFFFCHLCLLRFSIVIIIVSVGCSAKCSLFILYSFLSVPCKFIHYDKFE